MHRVVRIQSRVCVGGPALHTILLAQGLSAESGSRYDTTLFSGELEPGEASMEGYAADRGVRVHSVPGMVRAVRPAQDLRAVAFLTRAIAAQRPTIVHTHTAKAGALGRVAAVLAGAPVILHTFHGHVFEGYFTPSRVRAFVEVERALARVSDRILAISETQREELVDRYRIAPADKVHVIPLGVELDRFLAASPSGEVRTALGFAPEDEVIVSAGRLVPIKRYDLLIEAFAQVVAQRPRARLVIVGDGELRGALEAQARQVSDRVHFMGLRHDLHRIFADASVFALTSDNEGTPVAAIEALAAGVPAVATQVGGVADVLGPECGHVVPRGDVGAVARALCDLLERGARLPEPVRRGIFDRFSHRRLVRDMTNFYDRLLEQRATAPRAWAAQRFALRGVLG